jgi:hypothetical protein
MKKFTKTYHEIITVPNLLLAWEEFLAGKKKRQDVIAFQGRLMNHIFDLYYDLKKKIIRMVIIKLLIFPILNRVVSIRRLSAIVYFIIFYIKKLIIISIRNLLMILIPAA